ncbi:MAG: histidine phosphatase family protein [Deltaproteobacteria bacterium]|nr:histidine phosphatase family protein [Deltaproteobacteria bacterium]
MEPAMRFGVVSKIVLLCFVFGLIVSCVIGKDDEAIPNIQSSPGTKTTIVLLRHGGRDPNVDGTDPPLTGRGRKRAAELPAAIGNMGVTAIYCPNLRRNIETAQPLADLLGLKINIISNRRLFDPKKLAKELLDEFILKHPNGVVVWIGNYRNLEELYKLVDGTGDPPTKYGLICIVTIPDIGPPRIKKITYGEEVGMY